MILQIKAMLLIILCGDYSALCNKGIKVFHMDIDIRNSTNIKGCGFRTILALNVIEYKNKTRANNVIVHLNSRRQIEGNTNGNNTCQYSCKTNPQIFTGPDMYISIEKKFFFNKTNGYRASIANISSNVTAKHNSNNKNDLYFYYYYKYYFDFYDVTGHDNFIIQSSEHMIRLHGIKANILNSLDLKRRPKVISRMPRKTIFNRKTLEKFYFFASNKFTPKITKTFNFLNSYSFKNKYGENLNKYADENIKAFNMFNFKKIVLYSIKGRLIVFKFAFIWVILEIENDLICSKTLRRFKIIKKLIC